MQTCIQGCLDQGCKLALKVAWTMYANVQSFLVWFTAVVLDEFILSNCLDSEGF